MRGSTKLIQRRWWTNGQWGKQESSYYKAQAAQAGQVVQLLYMMITLFEK